jgi:hypothetical protein
MQATATSYTSSPIHRTTAHVEWEKCRAPLHVGAGCHDHDVTWFQFTNVPLTATTPPGEWTASRPGRFPHWEKAVEGRLLPLLEVPRDGARERKHNTRLGPTHVLINNDLQ